MKTYYVCTSYEKTHTLDHYETGCDLQCRMVSSGYGLHIARETLPELFADLADLLDIHGDKIDDVWLPGEGSKRVCWNRMETARGQKPSKATMEKFERNEVKLYLADYDFIIERRCVSPIDEAALDAAGIKHHE